MIWPMVFSVPSVFCRAIGLSRRTRVMLCFFMKEELMKIVDAPLSSIAEVAADRFCPRRIIGKFM